MLSVRREGDVALATRDAQAGKVEAVVAAIDNLVLSGLSKARSRIEHAISWRDVDQQIDKNGDDGEACCWVFLN